MIDAAFEDNRSFGWACTAVFSVFGAWSAWTDGYAFAVWFTLAAVAAALTVFATDSLETSRLAAWRLSDRMAPHAARAYEATLRYLQRPRGINRRNRVRA
jgi:hypothetical protein